MLSVVEEGWESLGWATSPSPRYVEEISALDARCCSYDATALSASFGKPR